MLKLTAVVSLMLIGNTIWAAGISCDSCGSECASACGTRHFRSCCFNYLRRKRGPEVGLKIWPQPQQQVEEHTVPQSAQVPLVVVENVPSYPEPWLTNLPGYKPNSPPRQMRPTEDLDNRFQFLYD